MANLVFGGDKQIPRTSFYGYLAGGIAVDILAFWLPGAGDVFILYCRGMYWINGYKTDKMGMATAVDMIIEAVPVLEALPAATAFVIWSYAINVAETKTGLSLNIKNLEKEAAEGTAEIAATGSVVHQVDGVQRPSSAVPRPEEKGGTPYEEKSTRSQSLPPTTTADKNIGYRNTAPVDGVRPQQRESGNVYTLPRKDNTPEPTRLRNREDENAGYQEAA